MGKPPPRLGHEVVFTFGADGSQVGSGLHALTMLAGLHPAEFLQHYLVTDVSPLLPATRTTA